jgi:photosystem II stability/assembly factor-like uncharacterized protein
LGRFQTGVAAGAGRFVLVGHNGEALVSTDAGRTWAAGHTGVDINLDYVAYVGGRFIATGEGTALSSREGVHWVALRFPTAQSVRGVTAAGRVAVAVGDGGVVLISSPHGPGWRRVRGGFDQ